MLPLQVILGRPEEASSNRNSSNNLHNLHNLHTPVRAANSGPPNSMRGSTGYKTNLSSNTMTANSVFTDRERGRRVDTSYLDEVRMLICYYFTFNVDIM